MSKGLTMLNAMFAAGSMEAVSNIDPDAINNIVKLLGQFLIIGLAIWQQFRKKKTI